ncbi:hypothetical protein NB725_004153 [Pantoea ananatis]|nr:hypothetical protein [Pantoea ananatis]MCW0341435.1 hypothetical protein [Pantoea ananatis]MCW0359868.1 hypothetical protein [Pantoea ananatis]MCW0364543.1 hypothetical protein [Pantoea ananatis]
MLTYNLLRALSFWCFFLVLSGLPVSVPPDITQRLMREGCLKIMLNKRIKLE